MAEAIEQTAASLDGFCAGSLARIALHGSAERRPYPLGHLVTLWRAVHVLALRAVRKQQDHPHAAPSRDGEWRAGVEAGRMLYWQYLRPVFRLNDSIAAAHAAGRLVLRDTATSLPLANVSSPAKEPAAQWERAAIFPPRDDHRAAELMLTGALRGMHYPRSVAVVPQEFYSWAEAKGIATHGEVAALLDGELARRDEWERVEMGWSAGRLHGDALTERVARLLCDSAPTESETACASQEQEPLREGAKPSHPIAPEEVIAARVKETPWTPEQIEALRALYERNKQAGLSDFMRRTAAAAGVEPARVRQLLGTGKKSQGRPQGQAASPFGVWSLRKR